MGKSKNYLAPYQWANAASMAASVTSNVTHVTGLDNILVLIEWTGTPTGTFALQGLADGASTWVPIPLTAAAGTATTTPTAAGTADGARCALHGLQDGLIRLVYTATSGVGVLNSWISAKEM